MIRKDGYYWVQYWGKTQVAHWEDNRWWIPGARYPILNDQVDVMGERLRPPKFEWNFVPKEDGSYVLTRRQVDDHQ